MLGEKPLGRGDSMPWSTTVGKPAHKTGRHNCRLNSAPSGYSLIPWLPALTGHIRSAEDTDRFLWDFRRTLGELLARITTGKFNRLAPSARHDSLR